MSDADGDMTSGQEGGNDDDDDGGKKGRQIRGGRGGGGGGVGAVAEVESLQSGVSSDVEEGVNVEQKIKRYTFTAEITM